MTEQLALDRSERFKDQDGHLHVKRTNLSKSCINPYRGSEIPGHEALGLDPDKIYQLFRDPKELEKAAATFSCYAPRVIEGNLRSIQSSSLNETGFSFKRKPIVDSPAS